MQPSNALESHQPHVSAEERLAEQAREIQQLIEQQARASVKERPALPPLSVPKVNKALERPQLTQWMRLILSNLKAYIRLRAREVGEVPQLVEFKGQVANDMMDLGELLPWRTWDCVHQSQSAYARRYVGRPGMPSKPTSNLPHRRRPERLSGTASCGEALSLGSWGSICNGKDAKGSGYPLTPHRAGTASVAPRVAPQGAPLALLVPPLVVTVGSLPRVRGPPPRGGGGGTRRSHPARGPH